MEKQLQDSTAAGEGASTSSESTRCAKLEQQLQRATLINSIVVEMRNSLELNRVLETTAEKLQEALNANCGLIFPSNCDRPTLIRCLNLAIPAQESFSEQSRNLYHYYHETLTSGNAIAIPHLDPPVPEEVKNIAKALDISSILIVPLIHEQQYLGAIALYGNNGEQWEAETLSFVKAIAQHCAAAIYQCESYQHTKTELTKFRRVEDTLLLNTYDLLEIVQSFPDLYLRLDSEGKILNYYAGKDSNPLILDRSFLQQHIQEVMPQDIGQKFQLARQQVIETHKLATIEYSLSVAQGEKNFEARLLPSPNQQIFVIIRDVTLDRQAQKALQESENRFRTLYEATFEAIAIHAEGKIIDANHALEAASGYSLEELIGMNPLKLLTPESREVALQQISTASEKPYEAVALKKDGTTVPIEIKVKSMLYQGHHVRVTASRDLTQWKQIERELQQAKEELALKVEERTIELRNANQQLQMEVLERQEAETLLAGQKRILEAIATGARLQEILNAIAFFVEEQLAEARCTISLLDDSKTLLFPGVAPSLPNSYQQVLKNGVKIGPQVGSCGTAVYYKKPIIVSDIATDPKWENYRDFAFSYGLRACYSTPIFSTDGDVLGSFALYYLTPRPPTLDDRKLVEISSYLAGVAIERRRAEKAIAKSKERFQSLVETSSDWVWEVDKNGIYTYISPQVEKLLGYAPKEVLGKSPFDLMSPEEAARVSKIFAEIVASQTPFTALENINLHKQGYPVVLETSGVPIFDSDGRLQGYRGMDRDITERKRVEVEIRKALEQERELNELKSRFVSMTSHEFRTPLSTILSSTELLEHYGHRFTEQKKKEHLQRIQTAVKRMTHLLNDVLLLGKVEAGKMNLSPNLINLEKFCNDVVEQMQHLAGKSHNIVFVTQGDCTSVYLDENLLQHILNNLLFNAIKYSPEGGDIHLEMVCTNTEAMFKVQDPGIGIPEEDQQRLFDSFHRGINVGTIPGTGLGLAIVKNCVDLHGGAIAVSSRVGLGTTFTVTLPLQPQFTPEADSSNPE